MKVLVAIDASESSRKALQQALCCITHAGTSFILLGVEEPVVIPSTAQTTGLLGSDSAIAWQEEAELAQLEEQQTVSSIHWAERVCRQAGVPYISRSELGDAKHIICNVAKQEGCDLVVVGSHGYGVVERVLMGSVSDYVVHHAPCAVLVVRE